MLKGPGFSRKARKMGERTEGGVKRSERLLVLFTGFVLFLLLWLRYWADGKDWRR